MTLEYEIVEGVPGRSTGAQKLVDDIVAAAQANAGQTLSFGQVESDNMTRNLVSKLRKQGLQANTRTVEDKVCLYVTAEPGNVVTGEFPSATAGTAEAS